MPKFFQGAGPLGRDVAFNELSAAAQLSTPQVIASGTGTTSITGNNSAQTVFSDTWTALTEGQKIRIVARLKIVATLGADTPDAVISCAGLTLDTLTSMNPGASPNYVLWQAELAYSATASRGYAYCMRKAQSAALTSGLDNDGCTTAPSSLTVTIDPTTGTNLTCQYSYYVVRYGTGV